MITPTPLTEEQLALLDTNSLGAMTRQAEALTQMMRTDGWAIFNALIQQYELSHFSEMFKAKATGEELLRAQAGLIAANNLRLWPVRQTQAILGQLTPTPPLTRQTLAFDI